MHPFLRTPEECALAPHNGRVPARAQRNQPKLSPDVAEARPGDQPVGGTCAADAQHLAARRERSREATPCPNTTEAPPMPARSSLLADQKKDDEFRAGRLLPRNRSFQTMLATKDQSWPHRLQDERLHSKWWRGSTLPTDPATPTFFPYPRLAIPDSGMPDCQMQTIAASACESTALKTAPPRRDSESRRSARVQAFFS